MKVKVTIEFEGDIEVFNKEFNKSFKELKDFKEDALSASTEHPNILTNEELSFSKTDGNLIMRYSVTEVAQG